MRSLPGLVLLCLSSVAYSQITFEELTSPIDFNLSAIRQSPTGEYFVQAANDIESIYTSFDGHDWTKTPLPVIHQLQEMQFFSDGTPILKSDFEELLIRRNGSWYTMEANGGPDKIYAGFIKGDSLFVVQDKSFAYSLDKGLTFTIVFTTNEFIVNRPANLWKMGSHFTLHTGGAAEYLSIFTGNGNLIWNQNLAVTSPAISYNNSCKQVLINDKTNYYLVTENGLVESGVTPNLIPNFENTSALISQGGNYYLRSFSTIYKSTGCNFDWEQVADSLFIQLNEQFWVNAQGDIFLYNPLSDYYIEQTSGSHTWDVHPVMINYALIQDLDESVAGHQVALTSNALFNKSVVDNSWTELDSTNGEYYQTQYSPNGDLYINQKERILFSNDNGITYDTIHLPTDDFQYYYYTMEVLDNGILFIVDEFLYESYYTLNNGQDWIYTNSVGAYGIPKVKLVDNYILIANLEYDFVIQKINLGDNSIESDFLGEFFSLGYTSGTISDDGTMYFLALDGNFVNPEGLYRYRFGEPAEFLGEFLPSGNIISLETSGTDLYAFAPDRYYIFNGQTFDEYPYTGLPEGDYTRFFLSDNEYIYAVLADHSIYRSTRALSYPQTITGKIYHESIDDCVVDTTDPTLKNWMIKVENDDYMRMTVTNSEGQYHISVPKGEYTVSSTPINSNWDLCEYSFPVTIDDSNPNAQQNFLAESLEECADLDIDFSTPLLRRCFDNYYSIRVRNTGPGSSTGTTLTMELDPYFDFTLATIPYTQLNDSIIQFNLGILAVNDEVHFKLYFKISCDAALGTEHCLTGTLKDDNECGNARSSYTECQENIGSVDPNDKRIFNEAGKEADKVDKGEYIYYHIRFQNTGTDTAFNIRVVDPLSSKLDLSTIEMLSSSHPYEFEINDGPSLVVNFKNILLPDSTTNEPASHGYFKFRIKPLEESDYGTSIPNQAGIYFDFNNAVNTNEAVLLIYHPDGTREAKDLIEFNLYPNPTTQSLTLDIPTGDVQRIDGYEIINAQGQSVYQTRTLNGKEINVSNLATGIYSLVLKENGVNVRVRKFVKM